MKKIKILSIIAIIAIIGFTMTACDDKDTIFDIHANGHNFTGSSECLYCGFMYKIGDTGPGGGIVFYINEDGFDFYMPNGRKVKRFYMEAAPSDLGKFKWDAISSPGVFFLKEELGYGRLNTANILNKINNAPAAQICVDYRGGGKTDWFLPSIKELEVLYNNIENANISGFITSGSNYEACYFSSSNTKAVSDCANVLNFSTGLTHHNYAKRVEANVRAIRAF